MATGDDRQPQRTLKGRRDQPSTFTRFDENVLGKENAELEEQLSKSQEMRNRWKKSLEKAKSDVSSVYSDFRKQNSINITRINWCSNQSVSYDS